LFFLMFDSGSDGLSAADRLLGSWTFWIFLASGSQRDAPKKNAAKPPRRSRLLSNAGVEALSMVEWIQPRGQVEWRFPPHDWTP